MINWILEQRERVYDLASIRARATKLAADLDLSIDDANWMLARGKAPFDKPQWFELSILYEEWKRRKAAETAATAKPAVERRSFLGRLSFCGRGEILK